MGTEGIKAEGVCFDGTGLRRCDRVVVDREAAVPPGKEGSRPGGTPAPASRDNHFVDRKRPVHLPNKARHNQPVILFVTVCTEGRRPVLTSARAHEALAGVWVRATQYRVGRYILMPDHIHLFCSPAVHEPGNITRWVAYWKRLVSGELREPAPLWQRDCWDTQLRDAGHYDEKWEYVVRNPVRKNWVTRTEDWPYQGCLNELRW